jgi:hypothetical protein
MARKGIVSRGKKVKSKASAKRQTSASVVYQLKITLLGFKPLIWRRIQVLDCTLDELHEHVQTAMGWTNSHLHHFRIGKQLYGSPELMQDNFEMMEYQDSTSTRLSDLAPQGRKKVSFIYEYDFGDSWEHEIEIEGVSDPAPDKRYPLCLEGENACPPDDCGGVWGYANLLETISNKEHEEYEDMLEWLGGSFDPEAFDPAAATKHMVKGLPDWR